MNCEVIEPAHVVDVQGYPCGNAASGECSDCGSQVCATHAERCALCGELFCSTCLTFHEKLTHGKRPAHSVPQQPVGRRG
jgi:hypothetical protein